VGEGSSYTKKGSAVIKEGVTKRGGGVAGIIEHYERRLTWGFFKETSKGGNLESGWGDTERRTGESRAWGL